MNRRFITLGCVFATSLYAASASAQSTPTPAPDSPTEPTEDPAQDTPAEEPSKKAEEQAPSIGYDAEAGLATTHVSQGVPKYSSKTTPATEDFAGLRFKLGSYGTTTAGAHFSTALASAESQPKSALEIVPMATHAFKVAPFSFTAGFRVKLAPRADEVDEAYEGIFKASVPNPYITPVIELWPEFVQKRGLYAIAGGEHDFHAGRFSIKPRATYGMQGYDLKSEHFHANELMATVQTKLELGDGFYGLVKPGYSYLVGPAHFVKDASFEGRSLFFAMVAIGAER